MGENKERLGSKVDGHDVTSLKGTAISLAVVVGGVILFTYIVVYGLYMARL